MINQKGEKVEVHDKQALQHYACTSVWCHLDTPQIVNILCSAT